jgi:hypothetical protein
MMPGGCDWTCFLLCGREWARLSSHNEGILEYSGSRPLVSDLLASRGAMASHLLISLLGSALGLAACFLDRRMPIMSRRSPKPGSFGERHCVGN